MDAPGPVTPEPAPQPGGSPNPFTPPPATRRRRGRVTAGLVVLALAAGSGVAIAATSDPATPAPSASASAGAAGAKAKDDVLLKRGGPMALKLGMLGRGAVHGEFTVPDGDGGYRTVLTQNGSVTAVDGSKLTVKSADGWSKDYTLDTSTMIGGSRFWSADAGADLAEGQDVTVMATVTDGVAHAEHVQTRPDKEALEKHRGELKFGHMAPGDMKRRMLEKFEGRGDRVFKFRGGHGEVMPGMPAMPEETRVEPAPEAGADGSVAPDVEGSFFVQPYDETEVMPG